MFSLFFFFPEKIIEVLFSLLLHCCHCAFYSMAALHGFFSFPLLVHCAAAQ